MSLQYTVSRRSVGHCTPWGVTPPLGINDQGVIQPRESLILLTPVHQNYSVILYSVFYSFETTASQFTSTGIVL